MFMSKIQLGLAHRLVLSGLKYVVVLLSAQQRVFGWNNLLFWSSHLCTLSYDFTTN